jgi:4-amino-4-deoxy-L-arabinose transferase-like glycosyltransferase
MLERKRRIPPIMIGLLCVYQLSRLWNLTALPMFLDESLYLYWARKFRITGDLMAPVRETAILQPVAMSFFPAFDQAAPDVILFLGRWLTAAAGALTIVLIYVLGRDLVAAPVGLIAAAGHVFNPFSLFYDRMTLTDGPLTLCAVACMWWSYRLVRRGQWTDAVFLGLILGLASYIKIKGLFYLLIPVSAWAATVGRLPALHRLRGLVVAYGVASLALVPLLVLGGVQVQLQFENKAAIAPNLTDQAAQFWANCVLLWSWINAYVPGGALIPLLGLAVIGTWHLRRRAVLLAVHALVLSLFYLVVSRAWYPRYVLPIMPSIWLCAAAGLWLLASWVRTWPLPWIRVAAVAGVAGICVLVVPSVGFDALLLSEPLLAPLPPIERWQYVEGWPSGYGLAEVVAFLDREADLAPDGIYVTRFALPGLANEGLSLWRASSRGFHLHELQYSNVVRQLNALGKVRPVFILLELPRYTLVDLDPRIGLSQKVLEVARPGGQSGLVLFRWSP